MFETLKTWKGRINVNGVDYSSISDVVIPNGQPVKILLYPLNAQPVNENTDNKQVTVDGEQQYRFTVKAYMTKPATPEFDFMAKWNKNKPMPLRTMIGTIEKETRGMVYVHLHGDIYAEKICTCMACGRQLTNPVSQFFGIGPECGSFIHSTVNLYAKEVIQEEVAKYKKELQSVTWSGWLIKSAILEQVEV